MTSNDSLSGGGWKPTPRQELLLRAALLQGDDAIAAWHEWNKSAGPEPLDGGSHRLQPLVFLNLTAQGFDDPALLPMRTLYRQTWARNQVQMRRWAKALVTLNEAGIPIMLLKACALIPLYYKDPGARPTGDLDVMVPTARDSDALQVLDRAGWQSVHRKLDEMSDPYRRRHYAHTLANREGIFLDLHRHLLYFETRLDADESFWAGSIPLTFEGINARALNPADQLLHACAHGTPWNPVPPIRWVADAVVLMRSAEIDWARVVQQAQEHQVILIMRNTLEYLRDTFAVDVPDDTLSRLRQLPVTRSEQVLYEIAVRPPEEHSTVLKLWFHIDQYRRLAQLYRHENPVLRFPAFLRDTWDLDETREVPGYIARFTTRWVARRMNPTPKSTSKEQA